MFGRIELLLSALLIVSLVGCTAEPPDPIFIGGETDGDGDADSDGDSDPEGVECDDEEYPCGPYGHQTCQVIDDIRWVPANDIAEDMAGGDGIFSLSDIYADESVKGILLFGTAGWCGACTTEALALNELYAGLQNVDGRGGRIEFVTVVFQDQYGAPATSRYAEEYGERYNFDFPIVADTAGDVLYYFDAQSSPGNVMIDATEMRLQQVVQGWDPDGIRGVLVQLDGSPTLCR